MVGVGLVSTLENVCIHTCIYRQAGSFLGGFAQALPGNAPWTQALVQILCCRKGRKKMRNCKKKLVHFGQGKGVVAAGVGYIR